MTQHNSISSQMQKCKGFLKSFMLQIRQWDQQKAKVLIVCSSSANITTTVWFWDCFILNIPCPTLLPHWNAEVAAQPSVEFQCYWKFGLTCLPCTHKQAAKRSSPEPVLPSSLGHLHSPLALSPPQHDTPLLMSIWGSCAFQPQAGFWFPSQQCLFPSKHHHRAVAALAKTEDDKESFMHFFIRLFSMAFPGTFLSILIWSLPG